MFFISFFKMIQPSQYIYIYIYEIKAFYDCKL